MRLFDIISIIILTTADYVDQWGRSRGQYDCTGSWCGASNGLWLSVCRRFAKIEVIEATEAWTIDKINKTNDNIIEKTIDKIVDKIIDQIIDKTNNSANLNLGNATHN